MTSNSFVFYESYFDAIEEFGEAAQLRLYKAICNYAIKGVEPDLKGIEKAVFTLIKPTLDANMQRKAAAGKGGRPRKEQKQSVPAVAESNTSEVDESSENVANATEHISENSETDGFYFFETEKTDGFENEKPNVNVNDNVNDNVNVNENIERGTVATGNSPTAPKKQKNFVKPKIEEIRNYCRERNNSVDPQRFFDFYESKGWFIGKSKMKDWKAAVRTWETRDNQRNSCSSNGTTEINFLDLDKYKILANRFD